MYTYEINVSLIGCHHHVMRLPVACREDALDYLAEAREAWKAEDGFECTLYRIEVPSRTRIKA